MAKGCGRLSICDGNVRYELPSGQVHSMPVNQIRIIGECTDENGPLADYWFWLAAASDEWLEISFYADGRDEFLKGLEQALNCKLDTELAGSTSFESRVLWPPEFEGQPLFTYTKSKAPGIAGFLGCTAMRHEATDQVKAYLRRSNS